MKIAAMLLALTVGLGAQTVIDGSKNPSAVPDVMALRLWLSSFGESPAISQSTTSTSAPNYQFTPRQKYKLEKVMALSASDQNAVAIAANTWSEIMNGKPLDLDAAATPLLTQLKNLMTPTGWSSFYSNLQGEKKRMKVTIYPKM